MENAAADKALVDIKPQEPKETRQVASLPAETTAVNPPAAGPLIKEIKIELKRAGCYFGRVDENGSRDHRTRPFEVFPLRKIVAGA